MARHFIVTRDAWSRELRARGLRIFGGITPVSLLATDPDAFEPDGDPRAAARWADDGGRA